MTTVFSKLRRASRSCAFAASCAVALTACAPTTPLTPSGSATGADPNICTAPATNPAPAMPAGVNLDRIKLLDEAKYFNVYTSVEAADTRDPTKNALPTRVAPLVDMSPSALNRVLMDTMLRSRRFKVYDMRSTVVAEHSNVLVTAKVVDASIALRPGVLEGGRRVSESLVRLSLQVKDSFSGENLLPADALVEGRTGTTTQDRTVVLAGEDPNSADVANRLSIDFKNALFRAFDAANERVAVLLKPMGVVNSAQQCALDLFGGSSMGMQANDDVVIFRTTKMTRGQTTVMSNTRVVALAHCSGVGPSDTQCTITRAVAGMMPQKDDYAVVTDESMRRPRER